MVEVTPLAWPAGWQRAVRRRRALFKRTLVAACEQVWHEIRTMGGQHLVISTNLPAADRDWRPLGGAGDSLSDPGAAAYWLDGKTGVQRVIACDQWYRVRDNVNAIALTLAALRGMERWGATEVVERAFQGFAALPAAGDDWWSVLGFDRRMPPTLDQVKARYREEARRAHPDLPDGDPHAMIRLNQAMESAERELAR